MACLLASWPQLLYRRASSNINGPTVFGVPVSWLSAATQAEGNGALPVRHAECIA